MILGTLALPVAFMRVRILPSQRRAYFDSSALKEMSFVWFSVGSFFGFMGLYIPFYYIPEFGIFVHALTPEFALYTIAIINAASTFGRVVPNYLADKIGPLNLMYPCAFAASILGFGWIAAKSEGSLVVICVLYGFFSGSFVSLPASVIVNLSPSMGVVGTWMGMVFTVAGIGLLIGSPIAGAILGPGDTYVGLQSFCGASVLVAGIGLYFARVASVGTKFLKFA